MQGHLVCRCFLFADNARLCRPGLLLKRNQKGGKPSFSCVSWTARLLRKTCHDAWILSASYPAITVNPVWLPSSDTAARRDLVSMSLRISSRKPMNSLGHIARDPQHDWPSLTAGNQ